jgi:hypothetical protein
VLEIIDDGPTGDIGDEATLALAFVTISVVPQANAIGIHWPASPPGE